MCTENLHYFSYIASFKLLVILDFCFVLMLFFGVIQLPQFEAVSYTGELICIVFCLRLIDL